MRQGCPLSPPLFNALLRALAEQWIEKRKVKGCSREKRSQTVLICWWYNITHKRPQKFHQKYSRNNQQSQQSDRIKNPFSKIKSFSIHQQQTYKERNHGYTPLTITPEKIKSLGRTSTMKTLNLWRKRWRDTLGNGRTSHAHEMVQLILWKWLSKTAYRFRAIPIKTPCHSSQK